MADMLDRQAAVDEPAREPKYASFARQFESRILSGEFRIGQRLPSERHLAATTNMTVMTVRQALSVLADKGLISRQQGRGTFVTRPRAARPASDVPEQPKTACLLGLSRNHAGLRHPVNWQVRLLRYRGIVDEAFRVGITLQTEPELDLNASPAQIINELRLMSGIILHDELLPESVVVGLRRLGVPVVAINCYHQLACCSRIEVNGRESALLAVQHLMNLGHSRIGLIVGDPVKRSMRERLDGYCDALTIGGRPVDESLIIREPRGLVEDGADAARKLLAMPDPPTAIFAASDNRAFGVIQAAAELGIAVPKALAVVGFDDVDQASTVKPALTTIHNPLLETGAEAVRLLHSQMTRRNAPPEVRVIPMKLMVRESCGAGAPDRPALNS